MEITSTFGIPDITDWWLQQEEMPSIYANLSDVECDISLSYHMVSEWRPVSPLAKMSSAVGNEKSQARPFTEKSS